MAAMGSSIARQLAASLKRELVAAQLLRQLIRMTEREYRTAAEQLAIRAARAFVEQHE